MKHFYFFALGAYGVGLSGSDRIFIELARRWAKKDKITIFVSEDGFAMCQKQHLEDPHIVYKVYNLSLFSQLGFVPVYLAKILLSIWIGLTLKVEKNAYLYNASEFWMDSFPTFLLKLKFPTSFWIATWYQTAPSPLQGFAEGKRANVYRGRALFYFLAQLPVRPLIKHFATRIVVNNESERAVFAEVNKKGNVVVLKGAVDITLIQEFKKTNKVKNKEFDAVFQGRFHPQKGVMELVEIWKKVVKTLPDAKLVMIGDGPLMGDVKKYIAHNHLSKNIFLKGYVFDGKEKYEIFAKSKLVMHPSFYDSGGMAAAEAMAFGLPVVAFDLKAYESYYPKGIKKIATGDLDAFAQMVMHLLKHTSEREALGNEAQEMIEKDYSWDARAKEIYEKII